MPTFTDSGAAPRFQGSPSAFKTMVKSEVAITTHAGFRQFEWNTRVKMNGAASELYEVGLIQNMLACSVVLVYSTGDADTSPMNASFQVSPLPILDSETTESAWLGGRFAALGKLTKPGDILPPGMSDAASEAVVDGGDDPGGVFPLKHSSNPEKRLLSIVESLRFVTWVAVRPSAKPMREPASYEYLRHVVWTVKRKFTVYHFPNGLFHAVMLANSTSQEDIAAGKGAFSPVLNNPPANFAGKLVGV